HHLLSWSSTITSADRISQGSALGRGVGLMRVLVDGLGAVTSAGAASAATVLRSCDATWFRSRLKPLPQGGVWARRQNHRRSSPGPSTFDTQRPHSCGCSALVPTSP